MITELSRTRNVVYTIQKDMGITKLEVYSIDNVQKPIYSKRLTASEIEYTEAFLYKIKKLFNQITGKRSDK